MSPSSILKTSSNFLLSFDVNFSTVGSRRPSRLQTTKPVVLCPHLRPLPGDLDHVLEHTPLLLDAHHAASFRGVWQVLVQHMNPRRENPKAAQAQRYGRESITFNTPANSNNIGRKRSALKRQPCPVRVAIPTAQSRSCIRWTSKRGRI